MMNYRVLLFLALLAWIIAGSTQNVVADEEPHKHSGESLSVRVYFDKDFYKIGQKTMLTIVDKNLNKHYDAIDWYRPVRGFVSLEVDGKEVSDSFKSKVFRTSFKETGAHTGIFKALLKIPSTDDLGKSIKGKELRINYFDIQNNVIWHDKVTVL